MSEVKGCPMCGGKPALYKTKGWGKVYACHLGHATTGECDSEEAARVEWNTRPIEDAKDAEIETLRIQYDLAYESMVEARAEVDRLRGIIREAEWEYTIGEYDAYNDRTSLDKYECNNCGFVFLADMPRSHAKTCPFYQWEGGSNETS